jgi:uncharacterized DUF497 family protein
MCITLRFEWDEEKNRINQDRHQAAFEFAARAFDDPVYDLRKDRVDENGEQRWHAIGMVEAIFLPVVHVI